MFSLLKNPLMSLATSFDRFGWTFQRFLPMVNLEFHFFIFFAMKFFKFKKKKKFQQNFIILLFSVVDPEWFILDPDPALNFPSSGSESRQKFRIQPILIR